MDRPSPEIVNCPSCGARNFAIDETCSSCAGPLTVFIGPRPKVRHVSLATIMIIVAVVAVCLTPIRIAPGLSLVLALILVPTTFRGILMVAERRADGRHVGFEQKVEVFSSSCIVTFVILSAAMIAFFATCAPIVMTVIGLRLDRDSEQVVILAYIAGAFGATLVTYFLGRRLWPRKD